MSEQKRRDEMGNKNPIAISSSAPLHVKNTFTNSKFSTRVDETVYRLLSLEMAKLWLTHEDFIYLGSKWNEWAGPEI